MRLLYSNITEKQISSVFA